MMVTGSYNNPLLPIWSDWAISDEIAKQPHHLYYCTFSSLGTYSTVQRAHELPANGMLLGPSFIPVKELAIYYSLS